MFENEKKNKEKKITSLQIYKIGSYQEYFGQDFWRPKCHLFCCFWGPISIKQTKIRKSQPHQTLPPLQVFDSNPSPLRKPTNA